MMQVLLYPGSLSLVEKSGVGRAIRHQQAALESLQIPYTMDPHAEYEIAQYNTIFPDSFFASWLARKKGKKVIYYGHSTMEDFQNSFIGSNLFAPLFKWWITRCYRHGDVILTPTEYSKELLDGYGIDRPILALSNGIDLNFYKRDKEAGKRFRQMYGIAEDERVIVSVGHYIERKGIVEFVELARSMPEYRFLWFGYTNPHMVPKEVQDALEIKLPNLSFPGYVTREQLRDVYSGSDLFLFLTHEETEGIVLLEALAMKLPILVRDIPIYKQWLPENETAYKARSFEEFQEKIVLMLERQLPSLVEAGYRVAEERSLDRIGEYLQRIYQSMAEGTELPHSFSMTAPVQTK